MGAYMDAKKTHKYVVSYGYYSPYSKTISRSLMSLCGVHNRGAWKGHYRWAAVSCERCLKKRTLSGGKVEKNDYKR